MTPLGIGPEARRRLSARRTAEIVADELRRQIIDGELADGDLLPRQELLVEQFNVSLVSLREALRILETEGLVSVRRGNRGGAVVHAPAKASGPTMRPFSKWTAVRMPPTSRFNLISLGHCAVEEPPPIVRGIEGSFKLSKMAVRKEFRNCSLTVTVASAAGALAARLPRVADDSCA